MASKLFKKVERCYNAGEVIFEQGSESDGIYSVKMGWVSVYKTKPSPNGPVDIEIVKLGPGSMFGEMGMLDGTRRDASVRAVDYVECVVITQEMFENQMANLPPWVVNFIKILLSRLRTTNDKLLTTLQILESHGLAPADPAVPGAQSPSIAPAAPPAAKAPGPGAGAPSASAPPAAAAPAKAPAAPAPGTSPAAPPKPASAAPPPPKS